jgi:hypothetical protein
MEQVKSCQLDGFGIFGILIIRILEDEVEILIGFFLFDLV